MRTSDWSSDVCSSDLILGITAGLALGLDRAVRDLELIFDRGGHRLADALGIGVRCEDDVRGAAHVAGRHRPDMEVMNVCDAIDGCDPVADLPQIEIPRHAFEKDIRGVAQKYPCSRQHP